MAKYIWAFLVFTSIAYGAPVTAVSKLPDGVILKTDPGQLRLQVFSDHIIRVTYAQTSFPADASLSVIAHPISDGWEVNETPDAIELRTKAISARVDRKTGVVGFYDLDNKPILREADDGRAFAATTIPSANGTIAAQSFALTADEAVFGLGQHQSGLWNYRGKSVRLQQKNMEIAIPMLLSTRGYGLLWDNPAITDVEVGINAAPGILRWKSEIGEVIDYYFILGPSPDEIIHGYRQLTGPVPMFGKWAWGYWQSRERYASQEDLLKVAREYRKRGIPIDCMIQDWRYWDPQPWGSHAFGKNYPDPDAMMDELHAANFHAIISVWARFEPGSKNYEELDKAGFLYSLGKIRYYDAFNPAARQMYWRQMSDEIFSHGLDGWWLDATEPEMDTKWGEVRDVKTILGPGYKVANAYPLMTTGGVYQGQRAQTSDKRVFILTRSAYAGQQRNSAVSWSGDIRGDWATYKAQIPAGLNFISSGIPYWNTDIGGFFSGKNSDEAYRELYIRWFQFGSFCPMFRSHGTNTQKEIWSFGPTAEPILTKYDQLRYRLIPYIYSVAWKVTSQDYTMMRPLMMDFGDDPKALTISDQFMFGPALMACPVTERGAVHRELYLPAGNWHDFWTGAEIEGGRSIQVPAPLDTMPIFVKPGSIIPMGPNIQYAMEKSDPIEIRIYRGASGAFTLYEDEGDNYQYEKKIYATIPMTWDEKAATLTIGERQGAFPGMLKERTFNIVFAKEGHGQGEGVTDKPDQTVQYSGGRIVVKVE